MKTLTIEHLKGYLGTMLEFRDSLAMDVPTYQLNCNNLSHFENGNIKIIPLLYPLSTLTEFREDLGFVPIEKFTEDVKDDLMACMRDSTYYEMLYSFVINSLYEWHTDIHGLIEQGLAIDKTNI